MIGAELGPYRIEEQLGSGGMGTVYRATALSDAGDARAGATVALKVIHAHLVDGRGFVERFRREAALGREVDHLNVVRTLDVGSTELADHVAHYLALEFVRGQTLRELATELGRVPEGLCRHVAREIARGLGAIHAVGAIHRDIKPQNVLITPEHEVKIMDLGLARWLEDEDRLSRTGAFVGTLGYAAPEQFRRNQTLDERVDLYALGVLLYELAAGAHPMEGGGFEVVMRRVLEDDPAPLGEAHPQLSPYFEEVVHTLLAKRPEDRFGTAAQLGEVLAAGESARWWRERAHVLRGTGRRGLRRIRIPRETALYGRSEELARLRAEFDRVRGGDGRVLFVGGEVGIGKSRLLDEFVNGLRAAGEPLHFLYGGYPPGGAATAQGAFVDALREHFGSEPSAEVLADALGASSGLAPAFARLLLGEVASGSAAPLDKDVVHTLFVRVLERLTTERPVVLLIEDLHFAPEQGRALFAAVALACARHRLMLVGTHRPGLPADWLGSIERLRHGARIDLERLPREDVEPLLEEALATEVLPPALVGAISERTDGNPFFVFELVRGLREAREAESESGEKDDSWMRAESVSRLQAPESLRELVEARVASLQQEERELLEAAACCGFEFDPLLLAAALGTPRIALLKSLGRIEKVHRLVRSAGRSYVFDHHLVQETLYDGLSELLRAEYHGALADALEAGADSEAPGGADLPGAVTLALTRHRLRAGQDAAALRHAERALDHLAGVSNPALAADLAAELLARPGLLEGRARFDLLYRRAGLLDLLGRPEERRVLVDELRACADEVGDTRRRALARRHAGWFLYQQGEFDAAEQVLSEAVEFAREVGDEGVEGSAVGNLGLVYWSLGRNEESITHHERHRELARAAGNRASEADAVANLGTVLRTIGRHDEALAHHRESLEIARGCGHDRGEARASGSIGAVLYNLGRYEEAIPYTERHLEIARRIGNRRGEIQATGNLALDHAGMGRLQEAATGLARQVELVRQIGDRRMESSALGNLGYVLGALGRYGEARTQFLAQRELAREIGYPFGEAHATANLGTLLSVLGDADAARATLEHARSLCKQVGAKRQEAVTVHGLARIAFEVGAVSEARAHYRTAVDMRRELARDGVLAGTLIGLGELEARSGDAETAQAHLGEAVEISRSTDSASTLVLARLHLAAYEGGGGGGGGGELVAAAVAAFEEHGARLEHREQLEARYLLWRVTGEFEHLRAAWLLLGHALDHAPAECRADMLNRVAVHAAIRDAWTAEQELRETMVQDFDQSQSADD